MLVPQNISGGINEISKLLYQQKHSFKENFLRLYLLQ